MKGAIMIKRLLLASLLALSASTCTDQRSHSKAVYMLIDTSGTYAQEVGKAQRIINYLLGTLESGDSLAVARVKTRSFSEKDIIAKVTFDSRPSQANAQKRAFRDKIDAFVKTVGGSAYTDITGGLIQGGMWLNETGAGTKTILIFSDMQEELDKVTIRDFPINLKNIRVVALNVVKLKTDNIDPRRYMGRLEAWQKRVEQAGASEWILINDIERLDSMLKSYSPAGPSLVSLLELRARLLEGLAHRRPGLVGAALKVGPRVARGGLHLAQLFPGLILMPVNRGELLLVLGAHARLRFRRLALPLDHLGVPLVEL